tara:strand:+ start:95 stop:397 length:303 start_codon:yes stop_codon:yes gene_type:complete
MKDNFDLHEWNKKRYLNELDIDGSLNIDKGGDDSEMGAEEESDANVVGETEEKEYEVEYWHYIDDGYDNEYIKVRAKSEEEALAKAKKSRRGKNFKIYKG